MREERERERERDEACTEMKPRTELANLFVDCPPRELRKGTADDEERKEDGENT